MSKLTGIAAAVLLAAPLCSAEDAREEYDFNFDGHADYRVKTLENGKADLYDVFLFDPTSKNFKKDSVLSGTISPVPDQEHKQVRCIWPSGHSGAIYSGTVYDWDGNEFKLAYSVRQTDLTVDGKLIYVCVRAKLENGIPMIESIERIKPHWEE